MRKIFLVAALFVVFGVSAFAADATVTYVSGKVEVQKGDKWVALKKGDTLSKSDMISTGFQSEAKIKIMDSVLYLGPVTRVTLEELSKTDDQDNVNVYLKTGSVRSQVKHVENKRVNYQVHTAIAVASCRGTDWDIDDGNLINCYQGVIAVSAYRPELVGPVADSDGIVKNGDTPTTADGVLVKQNQIISVSDSSTVSAPMNAFEALVDELNSVAATEASRQGVNSQDVKDVVVGDGNGNNQRRTGKLILKLQISN